MKLTISLLLATAFSIVGIGTAIADNHYDMCDNKIEMDKGEQAGGPLFGLEYLMTFHFIAERYCEASLPPLKPVLSEHFIKNGCGPDTEIHVLAMDSADKLNSASLSDFIAKELDHAYVTEDRARQLVSEMVEEELGGCEEIVGRTKTGIADIRK